TLAPSSVVARFPRRSTHRDPSSSWSWSTSWWWSAHEGKGGQGRPTALAALVGLDRDSHMSHARLADCPLLPFEGGAVGAEGELLSAELPIVMAAIARDRERQLLGPVHVLLFDFEAHLADRLGAVEDEDDRLFTSLFGDPAGVPGAPGTVERMVDGMIRGFGRREHGGNGRDRDLSRIRRGRLGLENVFAHRGLLRVPACLSTTSDVRRHSPPRVLAVHRRVTIRRASAQQGYVHAAPPRALAAYPSDFR